MCGIFVVIPKKNNVNLEKAKESLIKLKNRGPDYSFYKIIENVFFGQTVLSMSGKFKKNINDNFSKSKNFFIVYNGEIYNYKNLSKTLLEEKHKIFSDTQVLVNLFEKYSSENIHKYLDGMYAYVLYDKKNNKILISRDPQGEKSLYKYEDSKQIILSSEISPILHYIKEKELNLNVLKTYFLSRHFIQFDKTIYKNIQNIEPGQVIEVNLKNYKIKQLSSVSISYLINEDLYRKNSLKKEEELLEELDFLFKKNIQEMIPQKRNFTSIVSGGIDSTLMYESFALGKKTIFFDCRVIDSYLRKNRHFAWPYNFERKGFFWTDQLTINSISLMIDKIKKTNQKKWRIKTKKYIPYLMNYDEGNLNFKKVVSKILKN